MATDFWILFFWLEVCRAPVAQLETSRIGMNTLLLGCVLYMCSLIPENVFYH